VPNFLYNDLATFDGYCCAYHYTLGLWRTPAAKVAEHVGMSTRAIENWRRRLRDGKLRPCEKCPAIGQHTLHPITIQYLDTKARG
jgi:hypothetical protein